VAKFLEEEEVGKFGSGRWSSRKEGIKFLEKEEVGKFGNGR